MPAYVSKFVIPAVTLIIGIILGVAVNNFGSSSVNKTAPTTYTSPLFKTQLATIEGSVTQVTGSTMTIKDTSGKVGQFPVSSKLMVFTKDPKSPIAQSTLGTSNIQPDKKATMILELENGQFKVTSVNYAK